MAQCDFKVLAGLLENNLDLDSQLEVLGHLDECPICRDMIYRLSRERDNGYFRDLPYDVERVLAGRA